MISPYSTSFYLMIFGLQTGTIFSKFSLSISISTQDRTQLFLSPLEQQQVRAAFLQKLREMSPLSSVLSPFYSSAAAAARVGGERPGRIFTTMNDPGRESHCSQVKRLGRARAKPCSVFFSCFLVFELFTITNCHFYCPI